MDAGGIFTVIASIVGVIVGYALRPFEELFRDIILGRRDRKKRQAEEQREAVKNLQQAMFDLDRAVSVIRSPVHFVGEPNPEAAVQEAMNRVNMYRVRVLDAELLTAVQAFYRAAFVQWYGTQNKAEAKDAIATKERNLDVANERIGVLLNTL